MVGSILSGIGSIIDAGYNIHQNEWNKDFSEKQFKYQQDLNKQIMQREDTAVQRRVKDLEAAGMSKWLAAGQGAGAGGSVSSSGGSASASPVSNLSNAINGAMGVYGAIQQVDQSKAQAELMRAQAGTEINYRRQQIEADTNLSKSQKAKLLQDMEVQQWNLDKSIYKGIRTNDNMMGIYNSVEAFSNMVNNEVTKTIQNLQKKVSGYFNRGTKPMKSYDHNYSSPNQYKSRF